MIRKIISIILLVSLSSCFKTGEESPYKHSSLGGDFELTLNKEQAPWHLHDSNGKVRILYFGFTMCPDICPTALQDLSRRLKNLEASERKQVQPIFISVDYKRDTSKSVDEYAHYFASDFLGVTGTEKEIKKATKQYGVFFEFVPMENSKMKYTVDHTSRFYLIDKKGELINTYSDIRTNNKLVEDIKKLL